MKRVALATAILVGVFAAAAFVSRAIWQHQIGAQLHIDTPNGIAEQGFVNIGGVRQWVQIRGEDRHNPVLLIVHGGPGVSLMAYTPLYRSWERHFTVVQWDQRGDGKTFGANPRPTLAEMQISRIGQDGVELTEYLRGHLHKDKILLLGHSWGSAVALQMAHDRPDLFSAFVATGFIVSERDDWKSGYELLVARARRAGNQKAVSDLTMIGPPPYQTSAATQIQSRWMAAYDHRAEKRLVRRAWRMALSAPNYSVLDIWDFFAGMRFSNATAGKWLYDFDARQVTDHLDMPVFFLEGDRDYTTPIPIARAYFDSLQTPSKSFIVLPGSGHSALITDPDVIGTILVDRVRPVVAG